MCKKDGTEIRLENPHDLSADLFESILLLIAEGGEVNRRTLRDHLLRAAVVGYMTIDCRVVAVAAMKTPHDNQTDNAFVTARSDYQYADFELELGYVVVAPTFRRNGFASLLCSRLCEAFRSRNLYATTRANNAPMLSILFDNGFTRSGVTFRNRTDTEDLQLFVRKSVDPS